MGPRPPTTMTRTTAVLLITLPPPRHAGVAARVATFQAVNPSIRWFMKQTVPALSVFLLLAGLAFVQPVRAGHEVPSRRGARSVVAFCCDFSHFPAMAN